MTPKQGILLSSINYPSDLKKLKDKELVQLCSEIREFIIDVISHNPGHLGASLGTVELSVALHYIFDTPKDKLIKYLPEEKMSFIPTECTKALADSRK